MALNINNNTNPPDKQEKKKEKSQKAETASNTSTVLAAIRKAKGDKVVVTGNTIPPVKRQPTGIFELDFYLGGGFPKGRYSIIYGPESCLDEDTPVYFETKSPLGKTTYNRDYTIEKIWRRLNKIDDFGNRVEKYVDSTFYTYSIDAEGKVFKNEIQNVIDTGEKECFRLRTDSGRTIIATPEHKFFVGDGYVQLSEMKVDDVVYVNDSPKNPVTTEKVVSIEYVGKRKTYDIRMKAPNNNYIANGIVVHNSCKTNIALLAVAQAQKNEPPNNKAVWINIEQTFDPLWAKKMGVNIDELIVVNPSYGEEAVDIIDALVRADDVAILVVDSVAALISSVEIAKSAENYDVGTSAMLIKRMVNKMMVAFGDQAKKGHDPCVILINQTRFKPGVMFGDPEVMPGGEAQKFLSSLRIRTYGKNVIDKQTNTTAFKEVNVVVKKSKVPVRAMSFKFDLCMSNTDKIKIGETDSFSTVKNYLQQLGLLEKTPKGYVIEGIEEKAWPTISAIEEDYQSDTDFCIKLQTMVNDAMTEMMLVEERAEGPAIVPPGEGSSIGESDE